MWAIGVIGFVLIVLFFCYVHRKSIELEQAFQRRFAEKKILFLDKHARIIAQESHGFSQKVGMGYLVLTSEELFFKMQLIQREISIPAPSLLNVGETRRMKGKNPLRTMLKVDFKADDGKEDALALLVKDLPRWKLEISKLIQKNRLSCRQP